MLSPGLIAECCWFMAFVVEQIVISADLMGVFFFYCII